MAHAHGSCSFRGSEHRVQMVYSTDNF